MKIINANQKVYVDLKEDGKRLLYQKGLNYTPNEQNLYEFTIWIFMSIFGEYLKYEGLKPNKYFDMDLRFKDEDFCSEEEYNKAMELINKLK